MCCVKMFSNNTKSLLLIICTQKRRKIQLFDSNSASHRQSPSTLRHGGLYFTVIPHFFFPFSTVQTPQHPKGTSPWHVESKTTLLLCAFILCYCCLKSTTRLARGTRWTCELMFYLLGQMLIIVHICKLGQAMTHLTCEKNLSNSLHSVQQRGEWTKKKWYSTNNLPSPASNPFFLSRWTCRHKTQVMEDTINLN